MCLELTIALAIALRIAGIFSVVSGKSPSGNACVAEALTTSLEVDSDAALVLILTPFSRAYLRTDGIALTVLLSSTSVFSCD